MSARAAACSADSTALESRHAVNFLLILSHGTDGSWSAARRLEFIPDARVSLASLDERRAEAKSELLNSRLDVARAKAGRWAARGTNLGLGQGDDRAQIPHCRPPPAPRKDAPEAPVEGRTIGEARGRYRRRRTAAQWTAEQKRPDESRCRSRGRLTLKPNQVHGGGARRGVFRNTRPLSPHPRAGLTPGTRMQDARDRGVSFDAPPASQATHGTALRAKTPSPPSRPAAGRSPAVGQSQSPRGRGNGRVRDGGRQG
jgi:hypothetical protein